MCCVFLYTPVQIASILQRSSTVSFHNPFGLRCFWICLFKQYLSFPDVFFETYLNRVFKMLTTVNVLKMQRITMWHQLYVFYERLNFQHAPYLVTLRGIVLQSRPCIAWTHQPDPLEN